MKFLINLFKKKVEYNPESKVKLDLNKIFRRKKYLQDLIDKRNEDLKYHAKNEFCLNCGLNHPIVYSVNSFACTTCNTRYTIEGWEDLSKEMEELIKIKSK